MNTDYKRNGAKLEVSVPSELDQHVAEKMCKEIDFFIDSYGIRKVVFDFGNTVFMDSAGVGVLIGRYRKLCFFGGKVYARNKNEQIRKIFHASGLERIISDVI